MNAEQRRRSYEATMSEISDAHKRLIETMDQDPETEFRRLEAMGHKIPGRKPQIPRNSYE